MVEHKSKYYMLIQEIEIQIQPNNDKTMIYTEAFWIH